MPDQKFDALIIGGGHNGLVCASYLAAGGLKVKIFESRHIVGGAAVTEEFAPGFRNSTASYTVSLLHPVIIRDLRLYENGLQIVSRPMDNFLPLPDGNSLSVGGPAGTAAEVAKFSERDAKNLPAFYRMLEAVAGLIRDSLLETPPNMGGGIDSLMNAIRLGNRWRKLSQEQQKDFHELMTRSAGHLLDGWFESDPIKAVLGFDAVVGNFGSPYSPGSGYVLLHHVIGEVNGKKGIWGHAIGGMGAITQAMAREAETRGVDIRTDAPVRRVLTDNGRAIGVELESGEQHFAAIVASNVNPKLLYGKLVAADAVPEEFSRRMKRYRCASGTFRMNVALSALPDFSCLPGTEPALHHQSGIIMAPSLRFMDKAYADAMEFGYSRQPIVEMLIPSTVDDTLAPPGAHVASLFCQHANPELPGGRSWDDEEDAFAHKIIDFVDSYAPNFKDSLIAYEALSPLTLENRFGLTGGDIMHGAMGLDQLFSARPMVGFADYRTPLKGLYLCGAGAHPGGGVSGAPGHNAAREILRDRKFRPWRRN
ncbi:MAG: NAD(P)/FAD-dependent oxidoreductase [Gammaproteobacteria bacterium]|nr:NAD(P)/FAD-dependent oxidoreductase [Gammaproteobacteria bacterium]MCZ6825987.1 NAD(P)/FAD-dependent oxidoreductase [Gammaproteobacteria bacterium]